MNDTLRINTIVEMTRSEGPGSRFAIWVQGCSLQCPECCNPEMFSSSGGIVIKIAKLLDMIGSISAKIEGVSLIGGEPFDQAQACGALAAGVKNIGLGLMTFTGYDYYELKRKERNIPLLKNTDLLKTGPYIKEKRSIKRRWIGSSNQELIYLTDRYKGHPDIRSDFYQSITIDLSSDEAVISGWPIIYNGRG